MTSTRAVVAGSITRSCVPASGCLACLYMFHVHPTCCGADEPTHTIMRVHVRASFAHRRLESAALHHVSHVKTLDFKEGIASFLEKRKSVQPHTAAFVTPPSPQPTFPLPRTCANAAFCPCIPRQPCAV